MCYNLKSTLYRFEKNFNFPVQKLFPPTPVLNHKRKKSALGESFFFVPSPFSVL